MIYGRGKKANVVLGSLSIGITDGQVRKGYRENCT